MVSNRSKCVFLQNRNLKLLSGQFCWHQQN
nr:MAG TPA: hypothetical protein [Caudoviricetes sp.]